MAHSSLPSDGDRRQELARRLGADAQRIWGEARARELAPALQDTAETLARVASVELAAEDAEPDFIR